MKSQRRFISTMLIVMVFMVLGGCGSGSGGWDGSVLNLSTPTFTISGTVTVNGVGLTGVTVTLSGSGGSHSGSTDSSGKYTITSVKNGNYTVTPKFVGYSFTPQNQSIVVNGANVTIDNFTAIAVPTFTISGIVTVNGVGLSGVTVTLSGSSGSYSGTSDSSGKYTITGVQNGSYTATPALVGYSFTPQNQSIVVNGADVAINDFTATAIPAAKVYVIGKSLGSVIRINANTLAVEKTINLGVSLLNSIVVIGDTLWYSWGDQEGYIGRYNLTTDVNETKIIGYNINNIDIYSGSLLRATPTQPGILYVGAQDVSPANIQKIDISVNPPVLLARTEHGPMGSNLGDFKISADGSKIWSACGAPYYIVEIRTSDMLLSGTTFDTGAYPTAVDHTTVNGTEMLVGGIASYSSTEKDIYVFQASNPAISDSYTTGSDSNRGNIAISKNASQVYSVHPKSTSGSELVTVSRPSGAVKRVPITTSTTFNSGIGVDYMSGRVFVATLNSVSVFDASGNAVGIIPSIAGASTILVVAP
jgi:hypothetical protein